MKGTMSYAMLLMTAAFFAAVLITPAQVPSTSLGAGPLQLGIAGRSNANASIASRGPFVAITWGATAKGNTDVFLAMSRDSGRTFGRPVRVNDDATIASVSGEQPPRAALVARAGLDPGIVVVWAAKGSVGTRLLAARSEDGGRSFGRPNDIAGAGTPGNRGWQSVAVDSQGRVVTVWLDHRETVSSPARSPTSDSTEHAGHQMTGDGAARAQLSKLFFARVDAPASARAVAAGVCYCCKTSVAAGSDGALYMAWRHVYPGNLRDIAFTLSRDAGTTFAAPVRVSEDKWAINGCPENGPAIAVGDDRRVHVIWPTVVPAATPGIEPTLALFYATSRDGRTFTPRLRMPNEGSPRHPQIVIAGRGNVVVAWDEQAPGVRRVAFARGAPMASQGMRFSRQPIRDAASAVYPVTTATADGLVVAWTSGPAAQSVIRVQRIEN